MSSFKFNTHGDFLLITVRAAYDTELLFGCSLAQSVLALVREVVWANVVTNTRPSLLSDVLDVCNGSSLPATSLFTILALQQNFQ